MAISDQDQQSDLANHSGSAVAALLHASRVRAGGNLRQISAVLCIRLPYLQAIEEGRFRDLPGATYAMGFVRAYAEHLGLDGEEVVRRFKNETEGLQNRARLAFPIPVSEGRIPGPALILVGAVLAAAVYGGWYWLSAGDRHVVDLIPRLPDRLVALLSRSQPSPSASVASGGPRSSGGEGEMVVPSSQNGAVVPPSVSSLPSPIPLPVPVPVPVPVGAATPPVPSAGTSVSAPVGALPAKTPQVASVIPVVTGKAGFGASGNGGADVSDDQPDEAPALPSDDAQDEVAVAESKPVSGTPAPSVPSPSSPPASSSPPAPSSPPSSVSPQTTVAPATATPARSTGLVTASAGVESGSGRIFGQATGESRVVMRAKGDSWIQVRDNGRVLTTRILRRGEVYRFPNRLGLTLVAGNVGALDVTVDGLPAPSLGPYGVVRRNIAIDPDRLRQGLPPETEAPASARH
ncbi:MAG: helix-turn-helix domain-containing protein [Alphaproteobacteria bacterium]